MLDSFIIERIRREREQQRERESGRAPLRIERRPPERPEPRREREPTEPERGSAIIDFTI